MKKKIITAAILVVAAITLVVATVLTTIAFLTSSSAVSNTFTVGNVGIHMYESDVDADGKRIADDPNINGDMKDSDGNNYHLIPGKTYDKDPTIYVSKNSDESYLFVKVRNNISTIEYGNVTNVAPESNSEDKPTIAEQLAKHGWKKFIDTPTGTVYVYTGTVVDGKGKELTDEEAAAINTRTGTVVGANGDQIVEIDVFDTFTIDDHAKIELFGGAKVTLTAFAIQATTFGENGTDEQLTAAWNAIVEAYPYENGAVNE